MLRLTRMWTPHVLTSPTVEFTDTLDFISSIGVFLLHKHTSRDMVTNEPQCDQVNYSLLVSCNGIRAADRFVGSLFVKSLKARPFDVGRTWFFRRQNMSFEGRGSWYLLARRAAAAPLGGLQTHLHLRWFHTCMLPVKIKTHSPIQKACFWSERKECRCTVVGSHTRSHH